MSVVLPNHNHARHLPTALDAILGQARPADEVIVVDDGSTDHSLSVIEGYAREHPSVRLLALGHNQGAVAALTAGLAAATGRYVYLGAADDEVLPGFFELGLERLEGHPEVGLFTGTTLLEDAASGRRTGRRPAVWPRYWPGVVSPARAAQLLRTSDNWVLTGASLLLNEAISEAGGLAADLGSFVDGFLVRKIALRRGFYFHPRPVAVWKVDKASLSRRTATSPEEAAKALALYSERIGADPLFPSGYAEEFGRRWRFATARIALELPVEERAVIQAVAAERPLDREVLVRLAPRLPDRLSRAVSLCWLYVRLRPTTLWGVLVSGVAGRLAWPRQGQRRDLAVPEQPALPGSDVQICPSNDDA